MVRLNCGLLSKCPMILWALLNPMIMIYLSNNAQEKQFAAEINNLDDISPFQVDMSVSARVAEMVQKTSVVYKQLHFLSKIP
jgi:hypothetical protein